MPAVQKINEKSLKDESNKATKDDVTDIFAQLGALGSSPKSERPAETAPVQQKNKFQSEEKPRQIETVANTVSTTSLAEAKDDKPGYISLVIPNSLKKKWKLYCMQHEISLTDCIKMAMINLEKMEESKMIEIDGNTITYRGQ